MGKIFYLMGKSSSGKDTIYHHLLKDDELNLKEIVLYTTRPIRAGEQDGVQYHFVDESTVEALDQQGKIIELREYQTFHGPWKYFTVDDEAMDLSHNDYLVIGTIESYIKTKEYYGTENVFPIMIELDDGCRLQRALDREKKEEHPKYEEMCRRFLADAKDFSPQMKQKAGITKEFINNDLQQCIQEIKEYLVNC